MSKLHFLQVNVTEIFLVVVEIGLPVPTYPRIGTTKLFNHHPSAFIDYYESSLQRCACAKSC